MTIQDIYKKCEEYYLDSRTGFDEVTPQDIINYTEALVDGEEDVPEFTLIFSFGNVVYDYVGEGFWGGRVESFDCYADYEATEVPEEYLNKSCGVYSIEREDNEICFSVELDKE